MASKKDEKVQKNLLYVRKQMEEFLRHNYILGNRDVFSLYYNKQIKKESRYSKVKLPSDARKGKAEVDIDYETLLKGHKKDLVDIAFRCAVQIGQYYTGQPFEENQEAVKRLYSKHGVVDYNGLPEMGLDLHEYRCSECNKVWILQKKKLPKRKDPVQLGYKTGCCHAEFKYEGIKYYDNDKLQKVKRAKEKQVYY